MAYGDVYDSLEGGVFVGIQYEFEYECSQEICCAETDKEFWMGKFNLKARKIFFSFSSQIHSM